MVDKIFATGDQYTKKDIYRILSVPESKRGGNWDTGYHKYDDQWFVFCNVGTAGRTGHDYQNKINANELEWHGKTSSNFKHPSIQDLINPKSNVLIFYRYNDRDPYTFAGAGKVKSLEDSVPVRIVWALDSDSEAEMLPEQVRSRENHCEGALKRITINAYERNQKARTSCVKHYGPTCQVCGFDFEKNYGEIGIGFIHVHHIIPISEIADKYEINPIEDLRPVCPNCHAMLHRKDPPFTVQELKGMITL